MTIISQSLNIKENAMNKQNEKCIEGIKCDVTNCHYHQENSKCNANEIKVGPTYASTSTDTICATFKPETTNSAM